MVLAYGCVCQGRAVGDSGLSDLSDVSWLSSDAGPGSDLQDSAVAEAAAKTPAEEEDHAGVDTFTNIHQPAQFGSFAL